MSIHPTAIVDSRARVGEGVVIGPYAVVEEGTEIGAGCAIGPHAVVMRYTTLGAGCRVHTGAIIGDLPQDLSFKMVESYVRVGERCVIREHVTIHRGTKPGTATEIGADCYLMAHAHFAHNVRLGRQVIVANAALLGGYVSVDDRAFISGNAGIHQFVRVGRLAMVGGMAVLTKDVPPFCIVRSAALNMVYGTNVVGMRRAGFTPEDRRLVKAAFVTLYLSGLNVSQAVERLREQFPEGVGREMADFVAGSHRGICPCHAAGTGDTPAADE